MTENNNNTLLKLNPRIYHPDVIQAAAYIISEEATTIIDVDTDGKLLVNITAKENNNIKDILDKFNQEILNYSIYYANNQRNKNLREAILKRVLLTNEVISAVQELKREINMPQKIDDPENILKSWEEVNQQQE